MPSLDLKSLQIAIELWGSVVSIIAFVYTCTNKNIDKKLNKSIGLLEIIVFLLLVSDSLALMFRGNESQLGYYIVRISNFLVFACQNVATLCFSYVSYLFLKQNDRSSMKKVILIVAILTIFSLGVLIASQFLDLYYYFDEHNIYHRGEYIYINFIIVFIASIILLLFIIINHKKYSKDIFLCLISFLIFPMIATIIQFGFYGFSFINITIAISSLLILIIYGKNSSKEYMKQKQRVIELENEILFSQIKPHFIFNMLNIIKYKCIENPHQTEDIIDDLSTYFRSYLQMINSGKLVSFDEELECTKVYFNLQQKRFGQKINLECDVDGSQFYVPPFILQPIVENAINYGINKRKDGGTIIIKAYSSGKYNIIQVIDNGVGFDINAPMDESRVHVGIDNVKTRLNLLVSGELEIKSKVGVGTVVTYKIPK